MVLPIKGYVEKENLYWVYVVKIPNVKEEKIEYLGGNVAEALMVISKTKLSVPKFVVQDVVLELSFMLNVVRLTFVDYFLNYFLLHIIHSFIMCLTFIDRILNYHDFSLLLSQTLIFVDQF